MGKEKINFLDRIGIPHPLAWGYLGVLIFMMGDGMEQGWLSPYLIGQGLSMAHSATVFTVYGISIAIASWLSGVFADMFGARRVMFWGFVIYLAGVAGFVGIALQRFSFPLMLVCYAVKGFGYPLFAYTFLVWITYRSPSNMLGKAVGWFWFVFTGGLTVLGAFYSKFAIPVIGHVWTLSSAMLWALLGALCVLVFMKFRSEPLNKEGRGSKIKELLRGFTIMKQEPKIAVAGVVRIINTAAQFGFLVFMPVYMMELGFTEGEWLQIWGSAMTGNIIFNLIFGFVGDYVGWRRTVVWFGGVGCTVGTLLFYYVPLMFPGSIILATAGGFFWAAMLAGYVPLSALTPSLVKAEKGAAMSVLNLGAGLSTLVGPLIVGLFIGWIGSEGVIWVFAALYAVSAVLASFLRLPEEKLGTPAQIRRRELRGGE